MPSVLITGASRGIGLELAKRFRTAQWHVHACCRHPEAATELQELAAGDDSLVLHTLDVLNDRSIEALTRELQGVPIDVLINNAGIMGNPDTQDFGSMDYDNWLEVLRVNTLAPMKILEALIDNLEAGTQKHAVTISSGLGSITNQQGFRLAYSSSKAGVNSVMKSLSHVLEPRGIRVNLLSPGWVRTDMGGSKANLTPAQSADRLYRNITHLGPEDTGLFIGTEGNILPW